MKARAICGVNGQGRGVRRTLKREIEIHPIFVRDSKGVPGKGRKPVNPLQKKPGGVTYSTWERGSKASHSGGGGATLLSLGYKIVG